jgi:hypothetical protein
MPNESGSARSLRDVPVLVGVALDSGVRGVQGVEDEVPRARHVPAVPA